MKDEQRYPAYLWDMLDAAQDIAKFTSNKTVHQFQKDKLLRLAVERLIGVIGEAAGRVSPSFRDAHSQIPWQAMISQRNVLIHNYGDINQHLIWALIQKHIPALIQQLKPLVPAPPKDTEEK